MAIVRNTTPSLRRYRDAGREWLLRPHVDEQLPDEVVDRMRAHPGWDRLFASGLLIDRRAGARVVRYEGAARNQAPLDLVEPTPPEDAKPRRRRREEPSE